MKIGIFGGGVVGGGIIELIKRSTASGRFKALGISLEVAKVCVRDLAKPRDYIVPSGVLCTDFNVMLNDPSIDCIIEVAGGVTTAKDVVFGAIQAGKHVVTANKALIAAFLPEIQASLKANPSVKFSFEAAVCGGIPIIHALHSDFMADSITKVCAALRSPPLITLTAALHICRREREDSCALT